jgi:TonB family protein
MFREVRLLRAILLLPIVYGSLTQAQSQKDAKQDLTHPVTPPKAVYSPDPEYSEQARKAGLQGACLLSLTVQSDGTPTDIQVTKSLGMGLDEKSIEAIRNWRFEPARRDGIAIPGKITIETTFHLGGDVDIRKMLAERGITLPDPIAIPVVKKIESCPVRVAHPRDEPHGMEIVVDQLTFEGALDLPPSELEAISTSIKQRSYAGNFETAADEITERLRAAWQDQGYFKTTVAVSPRVVTSSPIAERIALVVRIGSGKPYRLGGITFQNNKVIRDAKALRRLFSIADGDLFDRDKVAEGLDNLRKAYGECGYLNFTSVPDTHFDEEASLAYLEIIADEGKQFYISNITLIGTDESLLREAEKDLPLKPGAIYNSRWIDLFSKAHGSVRRDLNEQVGTVDLTFDLRGCPTE